MLVYGILYGDEVLNALDILLDKAKRLSQTAVVVAQYMELT